MDFIFMVQETSYMFITGPRVVKTVTQEDVSNGELGGAAVHATKSGVVHFTAKDDNALLQQIRILLSYLPPNSLDDPPIAQTNDSPDRADKALDTIVPANPRKSYDARELIEHVFDKGSFLEAQAQFAPNAIVGFARLMGYPVGVVANQPKVLAGTLDIDSADKIARFVMFCDCFNIPLVTFVDTPGYLPGVKQEHDGIIRHGAKILHAYAKATVPKISIIARKAYGGAYIAMCSKSLGADMVFAYPTAEVTVMGPDGAVEIVYRKELESASETELEQMAAKLTEEYRSKFASPYVAAARGYVNAVIAPSETRSALVKAMDLLRAGKRPLTASLPRKHSNIPL
jgi:acetyl-CoA carboxylase carboxyltransferase component